MANPADNNNPIPDGNLPETSECKKLSPEQLVNTDHYLRVYELPKSAQNEPDRQRFIASIFQKSRSKKIGAAALMAICLVWTIAALLLRSGQVSPASVNRNAETSQQSATSPASSGPVAKPVIPAEVQPNAREGRPALPADADVIQRLRDRNRRLEALVQVLRQREETKRVSETKATELAQ